MRDILSISSKGELRLRNKEIKPYLEGILENISEPPIPNLSPTPEFIIFPEFLFTWDHVLRNQGLLEEFSRMLNAKIILAPGIHPSSRAHWNELFNKCFSTNGFSLDQDVDYPNAPLHAVGFIFDKNKKTVFPKNIEHPIHRIKGTDVAVSICYEAWSYKIKEDDLRGISLWLHPSATVYASQNHRMTTALLEGRKTGFLPEFLNFNISPLPILRKSNICLYTTNLDQRGTGVSYLPKGKTLEHFASNGDFTRAVINC